MHELAKGAAVQLEIDRDQLHLFDEEGEVLSGA
jgi:hypothetical protein